MPDRQRFVKEQSRSTRTRYVAGEDHGGKGGGFLGTLSRLPGGVASDLYNAAVETPGALIEVHRALAAADPSNLQHPGHSDTTKLKALGKGYVEQTKEIVEHPLRHPGDTLLTVLPVVGAVARTAAGASAATRAVKAGEGATAAAKAAVKPPVGERVLKVGGAEARGHYSKSAASRAVQKGVDKTLQTAKPGSRRENALHRRAAKWNERTLRVEQSKARAAGTRVAVLGKNLTDAEQRALRIVAEQQPVRTRIAAAELRAAQAKHPKEAARHQERITWSRAAADLLDESSGKPVFKAEHARLRRVYDAMLKASGDRGELLKNLDLMDEGAQQASKVKAARFAAGAEYVKPTNAKLGKSDALDRAQSRVNRLQKKFDTLYENGRGKFATTERPRTEAEAKQRLSVLELEHDRAVEQMSKAKFGKVDRRDSNARTANNRRAARQSGNGGGAAWKSVAKPTVKEERRRLIEQEIAGLAAKSPEHPTLKRWMERAGEIDQLRAALNPEMFAKPDAGALGKTADLKYKGRPSKLERFGVALSMAKDEAQSVRARVEKGRADTGVVGAENVTVSPDAPFIGNPTERTKFLGRPKMSSGGTFGHTGKPGSMKTSTGSAVEHALERNDTTNIVAERHAEAVRLADVPRRVEKLKGAGTAVPGRNDDAWMWTDKTVSQERIPAEVKKYLDNPEAISKLPEGEQGSIIDKLRAATFEKHDWNADPESRAKFEQLATEGKGVFVPRRMLGEAGKRSYNVGTANGPVAVIDAVNNTQKALLVYAKLSYPVVQAVSNAAMNLIQQGFAAPVNLTKAWTLERRVGPEYAAITDDIMGQGAVMQAAFHGQGAVSHVSQHLAHVMSSKVDTPARRAAFLHEADKAGFGTPEKFRALIDDEANVDKLAEVAQRAKDAIVDFGELGPFERNVIRRAVFVYGWQKGSVKYAGDFVRDHPVQAAALGLLGQRGDEIRQDTIGAEPSYLRGFFDVGGGRGINPTGVNFFSTPAQIGHAIANPTSGEGQGFLAPAPAALTALLTGKDDIGRPLSRNPLVAGRETFVEGSPLAGVARSAVSGHDGVGADLVRALAGSKTNSKSFPDNHDALWRFLFGGLYPRRYDQGAINSNAAREKSGR